MSRQKFENVVSVPTSVAGGVLQHALAVSDFQDQLTIQDIIIRHLPTSSLFQCLIMDNNGSSMDSQQSQLTSTEDLQQLPATTDAMAVNISNHIQRGGSQQYNHTHSGSTQNIYNNCNVNNHSPAAAAPTGLQSNPSSQLAEEVVNSNIEFDDCHRVILPQAMFAKFSEKKDDKKDDNNDSVEKKKNQPSKAQLKVADEYFHYYYVLERKQFQTRCPVVKSSESVCKFACLLQSIVENLEGQAVEEYERVALEIINMHAVSMLQMPPLRQLSKIQGFLQEARLKTQSSSSMDPLLPLQILLNFYRMNEEASYFAKQTLPNLINTFGSKTNPSWMYFSIKIVEGRQNHSLVTHLNNRCRMYKRPVHDAEQRVFPVYTRVRKPKTSPVNHVVKWTEHGGGRKKSKKVYIVIPMSLSKEAPNSIDEVRELLRPAQQQPLPPEHGQCSYPESAQQQPLPPEHRQCSNPESQFVHTLQYLLRHGYSSEQVVELVEEQSQVLKANVDDAIEEISNTLDGEDMTANNERGLVNKGNPEDTFDSAFANEWADKDQRQQEAEESAKNQRSQTRENEQAADAYEVKDYLSHVDGEVYVEWKEQTNGQWGPDRFQWIPEAHAQEGFSDFKKKYTPLKEEVHIDSIK